jgi:hypothetical protein
MHTWFLGLMMFHTPFQVNPRRFSSARAEQPVPGVSLTRQDVALVVQLLVHRRGEMGTSRCWSWNTCTPRRKARIDDFTPDNGATRIVPRSHLSRNPLSNALGDPGARQKDEIVVTGSADTVLLFNGRLWHSGTKNRSGARRRAVQLLFAACDAGWHLEASPQVPERLVRGPFSSRAVLVS